MKIWILGGHGFVGKALQKACMERKIAWVASQHEEVDVLDLKRLIQMGDCVRPTHIVNCAVYSGPDVEMAFQVNATGAKNAALAAFELGAQLVHLSETSVFDMKSQAPYREEDLCKPLSVYGESKLAGEQFLREVMASACVLRTSWVFGLGGKDLLCSLPKVFAEEEIVKASLDDIGSATYVHDLADVILDIADKAGVFHFSNKGILSRYEMAQSLYEKLKAKGKPMKCKKIEPISSGARYRALDTSCIEKALGKTPRSWDEIAEEFVGVL
jgi:dTDP-4-dehydrorhamnose reductase